MNRDLIREYVEDRNELHAKIDKLTVERDAAVLDRDTAVTDSADRMADLQAEAGYLASINAVQEATISRLTEERDGLATESEIFRTSNAALTTEWLNMRAEREGLRSAASDLLAAFDSDDVMGMRGDTVVLRVSFKSLMERLRHATTPAVSDAEQGGGQR